MTKLLEKAFEHVSLLTETEQDQLGQRLLTWYDMRSAIDIALAQANKGEFSVLDGSELIAKARAEHDTK